MVRLSSRNSANPQIPYARLAIERSNLQGIFNTVVNYRVVLVSAPPGYGKTTAVAQFARHVDIPCAWHSIAESDRDLPTLQAHTLRALEYVLPGIYQDSGLSTSPKECVNYLTSYIESTTNEDILLVLDDLQLIANSPLVEQWLIALVNQLPTNCHLILISRILPDLPLAELIAKGEVLALGQEQLRFKLNDAEALAQSLGHKLSPEQIKQNVAELEGWPAGIVLSFQPIPNDIAISDLKGSHGPEALFDALADIVLAKQTPALRDFILAASTFHKLTPTICEQILNLTDAVATLEHIIQRNLFATQIAGGFVFHRLFRNFLQKKLKQIQPERYEQLHQRAGDWHYHNNEFDTAISHYVSAGAVDHALKIVDQTHAAFYDQGKHETLLIWQNLLSQHVHHVPHFILICAMIHTDRYLLDVAHNELEVARHVFSEKQDQSGLADITLQQALIQLRTGQPAEVMKSVMSVAGDPELPPMIVARAQHLLALAQLELGQIADAVLQLEQAQYTYQQKGERFALSAVLQDLYIAYLKRGDIERSNQCLQELVALRRKLNSPGALALALNSLGYHYHQRGYYDEAQRTFDEGLEIISVTPDPRAEAYLLWSLADLKRDTNQLDEANKLYNRAYELSQDADPGLRQSVSMSMALMYRWQGRYALAERLALEADRITRYASPLIQAFAWTAHAYHASPEKALKAIEALLANIPRNIESTDYAHMVCLGAIVALLNDDTTLANDYIDQCISQLDLDFGVQSMLADILYTPGLLQLVMSRPNNQLIVSALIKLRNIHQESSILTRTQQERNTNRTYSLNIHTLGQTVVERDGTNVTTSQWSASKAREFFFFMLFEGAKSREDISLEFWPDSTTSRVRSNFHTTLYRVRQALGENVIDFANDNYRIDPQITITCDAFELVTAVERARILPPSDALAEQLFHTAIKLYRGPFLPDLDADWIQIRRQNLEDYYIEALLGAGQCAMVRKAYTDAIKLYDQVLKTDPYREEAYRAIFECFAFLGEQHKVIQMFNGMKHTFINELGVEPSKKTLDLYRSITLRANL